MQAHKQFDSQHRFASPYHGNTDQPARIHRDLREESAPIDQEFAEIN